MYRNDRMCNCASFKSSIRLSPRVRVCVSGCGVGRNSRGITYMGILRNKSSETGKS